MKISNHLITFENVKSWFYIKNKIQTDYAWVFEDGYLVIRKAFRYHVHIHVYNYT